MGFLADGSIFTENTPVSTTSRLPVYGAIYNGLGLVEGWISFSDGLPVGTLTWIEEAGVAGSHYPKGFTNVLQVGTNAP
jgi:hypothetical protein